MNAETPRYTPSGRLRVGVRPGWDHVLLMQYLASALAALYPSGPGNEPLEG